MRELKPQQPNQTMSSREIAELTGKRHSDVKRDIERILKEAVMGCEDYRTPYTTADGQVFLEYKLPRFECDLVVSGYSVKYRAAIIKRWHLLEQQPFELSYEEMIKRTLAMTEERILSLVAENKHLESAVEQIKPKADALDLIACQKGNICITDAAKVLQLKPKQLFDWLNSKKWIYKRNGSSWIGFQTKLDQGCLQHKVVTVYSGGDKKIREQVLLTPKGLAYLAENVGEISL